ncbi:hypothetical protein PR048_016957 [Dryococelus australis]|uniref:Uncharacterized protein n=1 Tax=Dryococelus australis TaxID=614101 RepID=A0ABQ9H856_9NEOP|nr:hypothetical protein PR048_016957 [Dryococelus australis]
MPNGNQRLGTMDITVKLWDSKAVAIVISELPAIPVGQRCWSVSHLSLVHVPPVRTTAYLAAFLRQGKQSFCLRPPVLLPLENAVTCAAGNVVFVVSFIPALELPPAAKCIKIPRLSSHAPQISSLECPLPALFKTFPPLPPPLVLSSPAQPPARSLEDSPRNRHFFSVSLSLFSLSLFLFTLYFLLRRLLPQNRAGRMSGIKRGPLPAPSRLVTPRTPCLRPLATERRLDRSAVPSSYQLAAVHLKQRCNIFRVLRCNRRCSSLWLSLDGPTTSGFIRHRVEHIAEQCEILLFDLYYINHKSILNRGATVAERLARSPPTKANRARSPAGSPDFRKWESCRTMPLVGEPSRGSPISPATPPRRRSIFTLITLAFNEICI